MKLPLFKLDQFRGTHPILWKLKNLPTDADLNIDFSFAAAIQSQSFYQLRLFTQIMFM